MNPCLPLICALTAALQMPAEAMTFSELLTATDAPETVPYTDANVRVQSLWKFAPADGKPGEMRPAIVFIHGGAWVAGDADAFLASLGFVGGPPSLAVSATPAWQPLK